MSWPSVPSSGSGASVSPFPVDRMVGEAISAREKVRPVQAKLCDRKKGGMIDFLFLHRMRHLGPYFLNPRLIPRLCKKAGVPQRDLRGEITSHRVRSTESVPKKRGNSKDLGHGYCTYDFFDQCPHRMACAKCSFYMPKGSTASALLEGKNNLLRMRQEIPLTEAEVAAVDDRASALESLLKRLANVPTPGGLTPLQLSYGAKAESEAAD